MYTLVYVPITTLARAHAHAFVYMLSATQARAHTTLPAYMSLQAQQAQVQAQARERALQQQRQDLLRQQQRALQQQQQQQQQRALQQQQQRAAREADWAAEQQQQQQQARRGSGGPVRIPVHLVNSSPAAGAVKCTAQPAGGPAPTSLGASGAAGKGGSAGRQGPQTPKAKMAREPSTELALSPQVGCHTVGARARIQRHASRALHWRLHKTQVHCCFASMLALHARGLLLALHATVHRPCAVPPLLMLLLLNSALTRPLCVCSIARSRQSSCKLSAPS